MDSRRTELLAADAAGIARAAAILRAGGLVALPTETVYGLGANALDARAVRAIFAAKRRPAEDPLIVHVLDTRGVCAVGTLTPLAERLAEAFWPGPLTIVVPKLPIVPADVTAGLGTVAVRVPSHPIARAVLAAAGVPIAAPSANLFGRPSPTRAEHVLHDLNGRIDAVLDGGPSDVGVESTIVDVSGSTPRLLRPGGVPAETIEAVLGVALEVAPRRHGAQLAPGMLESHYAPRTPLVLIVGSPVAARARLRDELQRAAGAGKEVGLLLLDEDAELLPPGVHVERVGAFKQPVATAARLFAALRALDALGLDALYARELADPLTGLGRALSDRLRRAAARTIAT